MSKRAADNLRKITYKDACKIRADYLGEEHIRFVEETALKYNVSKTTIRRILNNQTYTTPEQIFVNKYSRRTSYRTHRR